MEQGEMILYACLARKPIPSGVGVCQTMYCHVLQRRITARKKSCRHFEM